jgi:hypothetical protein
MIMVHSLEFGLKNGRGISDMVISQVEIPQHLTSVNGWGIPQLVIPHVEILRTLTFVNYYGFLQH